MLRKAPINMTWLIVLIVIDLIFAVVGSILWKKSYRLDPASEKDKIKFFVQNQLGLIIAIIALLPLVILIFTNKNMSGKQKGILGSIAIAALVIAGITGTDFNPIAGRMRGTNRGGKIIKRWSKSRLLDKIREELPFVPRLFLYKHSQN